MTKNTIVINGKVYDAVSGLPAGAPDPLPKNETAATHHAATHTAAESHRTPTKAKSVHRHTQKSQTLRRDLLKTPAKTHHDDVRRKPAAGHVARSPHITKFAPHPQPIKKPTVQHASHDIAPATPHPVVQRATQKAQEHAQHQTHRPAALSSRELKEHLIAERLATVEHPTTRGHKAPKKPFFSSVPRASSVIAACFAIVFLGGYLTYISMPNLSMRVAASHAGVDAAFPDYHPDGYRFEGPIAYNTGEVSVRFASNTNDTGYTVQQRNSGWDSQAVLDNLVTVRSDKYLTYSEQGLTIYTYDNNAAWVNGGVLYTVEGDAPLSSEQILRIAASM